MGSVLDKFIGQEPCQNSWDVLLLGLYPFRRSVAALSMLAGLELLKVQYRGRSVQRGGNEMDEPKITAVTYTKLFSRTLTTKDRKTDDESVPKCGGGSILSLRRRKKNPSGCFGSCVGPPIWF